MSEEITAIIVDDEESARNVLSKLLMQFFPHISIVGNCSNVEAAVELIKKNQPKVVFLDIEMPNYTGYEIVKFFDEINFEIIFVTAYNKYAIKAFEVSALDYLLKPIDIERLKEAVKKLEDKIDLSIQKTKYRLLTEALKTKSVQQIYISEAGSNVIIDINDIIAIEAEGAYSNIYCKNENRFFVSKNLRHYEKILDENSSFFRTHKSWLVNLNYLKNYSKSKLEISLEWGVSARLSKYKKRDFEAALRT
ncbi:Transcriptional regulatory protein YehT [Salinivirga cyanobacteriivorans]|uniref:Transcriptional regulatory protein YehT n=1 Tax=Salinivirga cyanobacteriivorans TaxID=1307839 RepID=A0A0S2I2H0_9BACT|nr:response regulator [Salinivirga cyanobacteriivorans]ALO16498.1 Transcriptional regulatory protein YehT [Salinivirga cyanobacteriivorans]